MRLPALSRRAMLKLSAMAGTGMVRAASPLPIFDGKTLDGWIQIENGATSLATAGVVDAPAFAAKLSSATDPVSAYLRSRVPSLGMKELNALLGGPSIYEKERFAAIAMRPETAKLLAQNPTGYALARLNKLLLEDAYPADLVKSQTTGWTVKDGAMASTGVGRGVIYTAQDYGAFRLSFTMRHVSGKPDHQACVLIFCTRPQANEKPLDALAGIQFQVPNGGHWDYRPGMNNAGGAEFTPLTKNKVDTHEWSRIVIAADCTKGTARMTVAQPVDAAPVDVLEFHDPAAGKPGPIALQMHNAGLFDEYKDLAIASL